MVDWDDLRFVLAVARAGSALQAARALKVNQTTVTRRIAQIEAAVGADLFESRQNGHWLTPLGEIVAAGAERVEAEVLALQSAISAQQRMVCGSVRFTSSEIFINLVVAPFVKSFRSQYPGVTVELVIDDRRLDLRRSEADVALRAGMRPEGGGIVAQRLPDSAWAAYCSRRYADEHGAPADTAELDSHAVVGLEGPMARLAASLWLTQTAPKAVIGARSNSLISHVSAIKAGLGVGMLPCFVGDAEPDLLRCTPPVPELDAELWLVVREEIKQAPHVRAFVDCLAAHMADLRKQLAGLPANLI